LYKKLTKTQPPPIKIPQNLPQPPMFTINHHKQLTPIGNEEENTTLSTIHRRILLKLKTTMEVLRDCMKVVGEFVLTF